MSRKIRGIAILCVVLLLGWTLYVYLVSQEHREHSWHAEYQVDIVADPGEEYSLILPIPMYNDTDGQILISAGFLNSLKIEEGNGTFQIILSARGPALQVNGTGK